MKKLFESWIGGIEATDLVFSVVDGPEVDFGIIFEIGYDKMDGLMIKSISRYNPFLNVIPK